MELEQEIVMRINEDHLIALMQGKKLSFIRIGEYRVDIYPPNHGIYLTWEEYTSIKYLASDWMHGKSVESIFDKIEKRREK